jgi:hypothetical protein
VGIFGAVEDEPVGGVNGGGAPSGVVVDVENGVA